MKPNELIIRISPFMFLKRLVVIEFFFALLPITVTLLLISLFDLRESYDSLSFANSIPYELTTTILVTTLQIIIIVAAFASWYLPLYIVNRRHVSFRPWFSRGSRILAHTPAITYVEVKQGRLAARFDYGALLIHSSNANTAAKIRDIPDPHFHARLIEEMVEPQETAVALPQLPPVTQLISNGENQYVEFKSSLMWDYHQQRANKALYEPVMKNIVAFLNTTGGVVLIGVADDGEILGLGPDLKTIPKPNCDGFENVFNQAFNKMIGVEYRQFVDVTFPELQEEVVCMLAIRPSQEPAFLLNKGSEQFYIRAGNASQPLTISKAARYIRTHFDA